MIRLIAAIDSKRGIANQSGIPWSLPADIEHFRNAIKGQPVLMGRGVYNELTNPFPGSPNYVLSHQTTELRDGFILVPDLQPFLSTHLDDELWVIGGAQLYEQTISQANELYITKINKDFSCTKFFPEYEALFTMTSKSELMTENNVGYTFETWVKK
jgi:dihydrofolate reductase